MKHLTKVVCVMLVLSSIYGFKAGKKSKNENEINRNEVYKGELSKGGKKVIFVLYLNADQTYSLQSKGEGDTSFTVLNGSFVWNKTGEEVTLASTENKDKVVYRLQENALEKIRAFFSDGANITTFAVHIKDFIKHIPGKEHVLTLLGLN